VEMPPDPSAPMPPPTVTPIPPGAVVHRNAVSSGWGSEMLDHKRPEKEEVK
jgi:hypothetical protein